MINASAYPRGLEQADSVHFSLDALLLAAFAPAAQRAVDLGSGCGVVGLGLLLRGAAASVIGFDADPDQVEASRNNARRLGFENAFTAHCRDVASLLPGDGATRADLVACNPPWRRRGAERLPASPRRQRALYGDAETLPLFCRAAASCLEPGGALAVVVGADRLADMLASMSATRISPSRLLFVHSRLKSPARFGLVEGRFAMSARLRVLPQLVLHEGDSADYTGEARAFCPWLRGA